MVVPTGRSNALSREASVDHLYALGYYGVNGPALYVYTVTPTSITEAPGSPYLVPNALSLSVVSE